MRPKPCFHCGINFMAAKPDIRLCNTCERKDEEKKQQLAKGAKKMSEMQILVECDAKTYAQIEEHSINKGISLSEYFLGLHQLNVSNGWTFQGKPVEMGIKIEPATEGNAEGAMKIGKVTQDIEEKMKKPKKGKSN